MNYERGGVAFVGCIILGIGVGTGFLAMAALGKKTVKKKETMNKALVILFRFIGNVR